MKSLLAAALLGSLITAGGFAWAGRGRPELQRARRACTNALGALQAAQDSKELDPAGHALQARAKLTAALQDLDDALKAPAEAPQP